MVVGADWMVGVGCTSVLPMEEVVAAIVGKRTGHTYVSTQIVGQQQRKTCDLSSHTTKRMHGGWGYGCGNCGHSITGFYVSQFHEPQSKRWPVQASTRTP